MRGSWIHRTHLQFRAGVQTDQVPTDVERTLRVGSSATVVVKSIAYITLSLTSSRKCILQDCFYVARARRNLISVSRLLNSVYSISFDSSGCMIASANLVNGLYLIFSMDNDESLHSYI